MKTLFLLLALISCSTALADTVHEFSTPSLVCVFHSRNGFQREGNASCVSKASIAKDKLETEVLALQKKKLEMELEADIPKSQAARDAAKHRNK